MENITWENCTSREFSHGAFYGVYVIDKRLPDVRKDLFHHDKDHDILVMMDGFLYNKQELTVKLPFTEKPQTSAELVTKAYIKWGISFANQLNGDFVICIYKIKEKQLLLFRDQLGIRPLAISRVGSATCFASDPFGLCRALYKGEKIDKAFLLNNFLYTARDFTLLPHKDVMLLKPGHYFLISPAKLENERYWFPEKIKTDKKLTKKQMLEDLRSLLDDAVKIRADRQFTASAHVSGGLDSGIIVALVRKLYSHQPVFYGFSWSPDYMADNEKVHHDERLLVEKTCELLNIRHVFFNINAEDYMAFLSDWRHRSELLYERRTVEAAVTSGVNLIFSGWGGDEFISISNRGIDPDLIRQFDWKYFMEKFPPRRWKQFLKSLFYNVFFPSAWADFARVKTSAAIYPYIKRELGSNRIPYRKRFLFNSRRKVHLGLINLNHLSSRCSDWYVLGQRNGIEYRYPLLDKRIVEYMLKVPSRCLVDGNRDRIILRELGKGLLPEEVLVNRSKDDPLKTKLFNSILRNHKEKFMDDFDLFRQNSDLDFVDFRLLESHIPGLLKEGSQVEGNDIPEIFYSLKWTHEFTKGYYGNWSETEIS